MLLSKKYLQRLIRDGKADYSVGSEQKSIVNEKPYQKYDGKRYVAVDCYDKQRVDHYELEAE